MTTTEKQAQISKELGRIYPQLQINVNKVCGKGATYWAENLLAHTIELFLSMKIDHQYKILFEDKAGENYITRSMAMSLKSSTSSFYAKYRRGSIESRELLPDFKYEKHNTFNDTDVHAEVKECLDYHVHNTLNFYDKALIIDHYYKGMNVSVMSERYDIQPGRIAKDVKKALKTLKRLCSAQ